MSNDIERFHTRPLMSKIVKYGGLVFLCGQTSSGADIKDLEGQTREALARVDALLAEAGSDRSRMLSVTVYLKSMADFAKMNECWKAWLGDAAAPARATVQAALAADHLLVEFSVTAAA